jgi:hypothetical protein
MKRSTTRQSVVNTEAQAYYSQESRLKHHRHDPFPNNRRHIFKPPLTMGEQAERELSRKQSRGMVNHAYGYLRRDLVKDW